MTIEFSSEAHVATIVLQRPDAWNAISSEMAHDLASALQRFDADPSLWVGVLAAEGPAFCVGGDLKSAESPELSVTPPRAGTLNPVLTSRRRKPLIAAVDGVAAGGGFELVLDCDLVVASTSARFLLPEVKWSLVAAAGGAMRLPQFLPRNIAMDMLLTGKALSAEDAFRWGLVNRLVEPGDARAAAQAYAIEICQMAPVAVRETRRVVLEATRHDEEQLWVASDDALAAAVEAKDFDEGIRSFIDKRPPRWTGR